MAKKIELVLKSVLEKIEPLKDKKDLMEQSIKEFRNILKNSLKERGILAEVFLGGSFAKGTVVCKNHYDADIFVRYDKKYKKEDISQITADVIEDLFPLEIGNALLKKASIVHGSRDYFKIAVTDYFCLEIVPVIKVSKPELAENITDLSYSHVSYLNKKIKSEKVIQGIKLAKAFCYAKKCYGAESYINGFSGYSLELLVIHYGSFEKFLRSVVGAKEGKIIIDIEKMYKNKNELMMDINSSKLGSPIILVDPTYKQRNALAALSNETFEKFKKDAKEFLKNPSAKDFELKEEDILKIQKDARGKKLEFIELKISTKKQEGDVAGTKLFKFFRHLEMELLKCYDVKKKGFSYSEGQEAKSYFVLQSKKEIIFRGPKKDDIVHGPQFKKIHEKTYIHEGQYFAKEKFNLKVEVFLENWKKKNARKIKEMQISKIEII